jgi:hypothetical protein
LEQEDLAFSEIMSRYPLQSPEKTGGFPLLSGLKGDILLFCKKNKKSVAFQGSELVFL